MSAPNSIYDIQCEDLRGAPLALAQYRGRPLLIVNTATLCGFSPQLKQLEDLWLKERSNGLTVIGVPSGDFGNQELGTSSAIVTMCATKFGITFPLLAKTHVKGANAHPLFQWVNQNTGALGKPRWNFYKYLVGGDGKLKEWYSSVTQPTSPRFQKAVNQLLAKN